MNTTPTSKPKTDYGLRCMTCGCRHLPVIYTRSKPGGRIMRRRQCRNCGKRMTTYEEYS